MDDIQTQSDVSKTSTVPYLTTRIPDSSKELQASEGPVSPSIDEFREKLTKWKESTVLKMMDKDVGVIENERADILADKIHEMSSRRKRKMMYIITHSTIIWDRYRELQKIIMLPSPADPQQIKNCLNSIEKSLENVGSSLIPWFNAYFRGLPFPDSDIIDLQEDKKEIDLLRDVTTIFYSDWSYRGFCASYL